MSLLKPIRLNSPSQVHTTIPRFIYGTAWKKEQTASLVATALNAGRFTAIDTACQPKHYREDLVGAGVRQYLSSHSDAKRSDLFIQTKFTNNAGQDPNNMPYDPKSSLEDQVDRSIETSLSNFTFTNAEDEEEGYLDSLVLHSPMPTLAETLQVWNVLEMYVQRRLIRHLGISNIPLFTLMDLYERATIKPSIVQNRFYSATKYDIGVRRFCKDRGIVYQSFWTLSANPDLLGSEVVLQLARKVGIRQEPSLYALVMGLGEYVTVLNGTTKQEHMKEDWDGVGKVADWADRNSEDWNVMQQNFRKLLGEVQ